MIMTKLTIAIRFFTSLRRPSFQKLTLSRIMTRLSFSSLVAGAKSSGSMWRLNGLLCIILSFASLI